MSCYPQVFQNTHGGIRVPVLFDSIFCHCCFFFAFFFTCAPIFCITAVARSQQFARNYIASGNPHFTGERRSKCVMSAFTGIASKMTPIIGRAQQIKRSPVTPGWWNDSQIIQWDEVNRCHTMTLLSLLPPHQHHWIFPNCLLHTSSPHQPHLRHTWSSYQKKSPNPAHSTQHGPCNKFIWSPSGWDCE